MKIIARRDIQVSGIFYEKGDEVEVKDKAELVKLNEKGYIEPLTAKQIQNWKPIKKNKEEL